MIKAKCERKTENHYGNDFIPDQLGFDDDGFIYRNGAVQSLLSGIGLFYLKKDINLLFALRQYKTRRFNIRRAFTGISISD